MITFNLKDITIETMEHLECIAFNFNATYNVSYGLDTITIEIKGGRL